MEGHKDAAHLAEALPLPLFEGFPVEIQRFIQTQKGAVVGPVQKVMGRKAMPDPHGHHGEEIPQIGGCPGILEPPSLQ